MSEAELNIEGSIVVVATGELTQTINICRPGHDRPNYWKKFRIRGEENFVTERLIGPNPTLDGLIQLVTRLGAVEEPV